MAIVRTIPGSTGGGGGGETTINRPYSTESTPDLIDWLGNWGELSYTNPAKNGRIGLFSPNPINSVATASAGTTYQSQVDGRQLFDATANENLNFICYLWTDPATNRNSQNFQRADDFKARITIWFPPGVQVTPVTIGTRTSFTQITVAQQQSWSAPQNLWVIGLKWNGGILSKTLIGSIATGFTDAFAASAGATEWGAWSISTSDRFDGIEIVAVDNGTSGANTNPGDPTWLPIQSLKIWGTLYYKDGITSPGHWEAWELAMIADPDLDHLFAFGGGNINNQDWGVSDLIGIEFFEFKRGVTAANTSNQMPPIMRISNLGTAITSGGNNLWFNSDSAFPTLNSTSWGCGIAFSTLPVGQEQGLFSLINLLSYETTSTSNRMPLRVKVNSSGLLVVEYRNSTTAPSSTSPTTSWGSPDASVSSLASVADGAVHFAWINLTANGNLELILDGVSQGTAAITDYTTTNIYWHIGRYGVADEDPGNLTFQGEIYSCWQYDGPDIPSAAECLTLYQTWEV